MSIDSHSSNRKSGKGILGRFFTKLFLRIGVSALVIIGVVYLVFFFLDLSNRKLKEFTESFSSGKVEEEFHSYISKLEGTNRLQVASIKSVDNFSKKDTKSILWDLISLPEVIVEIKAPVEYTYFIDLNRKWEFHWEEEDSTIKIIAPKIQAGTPAVNVSKMEFSEKKGSILRDVNEVKNQLKNELTEKLEYVATNKIILIKEIAREETEIFLRNWFLNYYFKESEYKPKKINIYFEDESLLLESENFIMPYKK